MSPELKRAFEAVIDVGRRLWVEILESPDDAPILRSVQQPRVRRQMDEDGKKWAYIVHEFVDSLDDGRATRLLETRIATSPERHLLKALSAKETNWPELHFVAESYFDSECARAIAKGDKALDDFIGRFHRTMSPEPYLLGDFSTVFGAHLKCEPFEFTLEQSSVLFRQAADDDILRSINSTWRRFSFTDVLPTATIVTRTAIPNDPGGLCQMHAIAARTALGLYKVGRVTLFISHSDHEVLHATGTVMDGYPPTEFMGYPEFSIDQDDLEDFAQHLQNCGRAVLTTHREPAKFQYLQSATLLFLRSMRSVELDNVSITECVRSMEMLLLKSDREGISHILCGRIALIADLAGLDAERVFKAMKSAYNIRSKHIHGDQPTEKERKSALKAFEEIGGVLGLYDVMRRCLLFATLLLRPKDEFLALLRSATYSSKGRREIESEFEAKCAHLQSMIRPITS